MVSKRKRKQFSECVICRYGSLCRFGSGGIIIVKSVLVSHVQCDTFLMMWLCLLPQVPGMGLRFQRLISQRKEVSTVVLTAAGSMLDVVDNQ